VENHVVYAVNYVIVIFTGQHLRVSKGQCHCNRIQLDWQKKRQKMLKKTQDLHQRSS